MINTKTIAATLQNNLFFRDSTTYAVLDGASIPGLLKKFHEWQPEHICLYRGELAPDLAEVAPYLIKLEKLHPFTDWVLKNGWGQHWGIFAIADADVKTMRKHFRKFLMVENPEGKSIYFRYYDPRVFREFLPTCSKQDSETLYGPVQCYFLENEHADSLLRFPRINDLPHRDELRLLEYSI